MAPMPRHPARAAPGRPPGRTPGAAAQWLNIRRWLDANPDDELAGLMGAELATSPARYARYRREYLGWGVFALMNR